MIASSSSLNSPTPDDSRNTPSWSVPSASTSDLGGWNFGFAILFLALYYIRPQDWIPGMVGVNIIRPLMLAWFLSMFVQGSHSPLKGWLRTPHDWAVAAFYAYVAWNAPSEADAGKSLFSLVAFYSLTTQALTTWERVFDYLKAWNLCLLAVASLGVLQTLGLDITGGNDYTESNLGRLALGTWLANNPNALGHTVVAALPLSYILFFWRGTAAGRLLVFPLCAAIACWCAWKTESKGSFVVGGILTALIFVVGRPKWVQIVTILAAITLGFGALSFLPRMEQMGNLRADDGVMGRLLAWEIAKTTMEANPWGVGWSQFMALINWHDGTNMHYEIPISTHSSYVQVGADLGKYGLFFWLLCLWTAARTLLTFKPQSETEERCRRSALLILIAYMVSGWMINRQYHTEFYLLVAVAAAIHRLAVARAMDTLASSNPLNHLDDPSRSTDLLQSPTLDIWSFQKTTQHQVKPKTSLWNRINWLDLIAGVAMTWFVLWLWDYLLHNL
jgi:O-Antigen ligase